jgi:elongator complex protein 1
MHTYSRRRDEDVTETMYRKISSDIGHSGHRATEASIQARSVMSKSKVDSKVNRICDAILHELQRYPDAKMQNIITVNVCKQPPDLDSGLAVVGKLQSSKC